MLYILRHHGLVAVPIDLDPKTLAVDAQQLRDAVTEVSILRLLPAL
jgi:dTDP-4-amino-4,6-dideoxygalactose transaminase